VGRVAFRSNFDGRDRTKQRSASFIARLLVVFALPAVSRTTKVKP
jgi:hypothetical protein